VLRWLVPVVAAVLAIGGGATASAIAAARPDLPPRDAAELLVALQTADLPGLSGTVVHTADLGLPSLVDRNGHGSGDLASLWSGSSTLRVWYAGPDRARIALLGTFAQSDIIRDGRDLWIWSSNENRATHWTVPVTGGHHAPRGMPLTPQEAAEAFLAAIDDTTVVRTGDNARIAGRAAYELVLAPRDDASLIREVKLAIDAEHGIPLGVSVLGRGTDPVVDIRFTSIAFDVPGAEQFRFNPPPGATVTEGGSPSSLPLRPLSELDLPKPTVVGEGWTSVLVAQLPASDDLDRLVAQLPIVTGDWGSGRLITTNLFSVLVTTDGRLLLGAVTPERLTEVAGDPTAVPGT
jgi:outer membrane lipoprotein-sorting protein